MQNFSINPRGIFRSLWINRTLLKSSIKHEVLGRYKGSFIGVLWSFITPLFMLSVYTFVFGEVFRARWAHASSTKSEFSLVLFAGLIVFNIFSECVTRAPNLIVSNPNYVKKVIFPLEILPWVSLGTALFHACVSLVVWVTAYTILVQAPPLTFFLLPPLLVPFSLLIVGLSWGIASLGVFLRDISQVMSLVVTALMFMSPIFYPVSAVPEDYRFLIYLNPLTPMVEQARDVMYWGRLPDPRVVVIYFAVSIITAWVGFAWFQKTRKGFADVL
jgi:lipopolysaccharide transport system permease protein